MTESLVGERRACSVPRALPASRAPFRSGRYGSGVAFGDRAAAAGRHRLRQAAGGGWRAWLAVSRAAMESFRVTLTISTAVTGHQPGVWLADRLVLVRDDFAGKRIVDA